MIELCVQSGDLFAPRELHVLDFGAGFLHKAILLYSR